MEKEFIPYQEALELKQLGFDGSHYILCVDTPDGREYTKVGECPILYQQAFRFFREKYKLHSHINSDNSWNISGGIWDRNSYKDSRYDLDSDAYKYYPEAELACLKKLIEIVKLNNNDNRTTTEN
jgi:hypothetical protein